MRDTLRGDRVLSGVMFHLSPPRHGDTQRSTTESSSLPAYTLDRVVGTLCLTSFSQYLERRMQHASPGIHPLIVQMT